MRRLLVALGLMGLISPAFAADYELPPPVPIRPASSTPTYVVGPPTPKYHWGGVYGGVQGGYSSAVVNFGTAASEITAILRGNPILQDQQISQWPVFSTSYSDTNSASFGGFIGYNYEWEDVIMGLELNYNHFLSLSTSINGSVTQSFTDSTNVPSGHHYFYDPFTVTAQSAIHITDIATFRARAGWEAGSFLPYAFVGLAVGRADTSTSATVSYTATDIPDVQTPPTPPLGFLPTISCNIPPGTYSNCPLNTTQAGTGQNGAYAYGVATGLGVDIAVTSHVFARGELEYIFFPPVNGIQFSLWSARVGAGVKF
jgi:opacity protein-like surface antigen